MGEISFSFKIKKAIMQKQYNNKQLVVFAYIFFQYHHNKFNKKKQFQITYKNTLMTEFFYVIWKELINQFNFFLTIKKTNNVVIFQNNNFDELQHYFSLTTSALKNDTSFDFYLAALLALFLLTGNVADPKNKKYHAEIKLKNNFLFNEISNYLMNLGIDFSFFTKNNDVIIYFKKGELISDFLNHLGLDEIVLLFENQTIKNQYQAKLKRVNNLDLSNLKKTTEASNTLLDAIETIKSNKSYFQLDEKIRNYCELKLIYFDCSLSKLVTLYNSKFKHKVTKNVLYSYEQKIKKLANK